MAKKTTSKSHPNKGVTIRDAQYSESYDEYLEIIYRLSLQNPRGWVKNKDISLRLNVKAPSVTNMLEKLSKAELIEWKPRSGIRLNTAGKDRAKQLVKNHILAELFLNRVLGMKDKDEVDKIACDLEHHFTTELTHYFEDLLGIKDEISNVDNFIMKHEFPAHIKTSPIYSLNNLVDCLQDLENSIISIKGLTKEQTEQIELIFNKKRTGL